LWPALCCPQVTWNGQQQQAECQKLHTAVEMPETVRLDAFLAAGALPPLAGGQQQEAGKENWQRQANAGKQRSGHAAAAAAVGQEGQEAATGARLMKELQPRNRVRFYSGGGGGGTPVAAQALLSPLGGLHGTPAFLRRRVGSPLAAKGPRRARAAAAVHSQAVCMAVQFQSVGGPCHSHTGSFLRLRLAPSFTSPPLMQLAG
jgi:hypothetical protein